MFGRVGVRPLGNGDLQQEHIPPKLPIRTLTPLWTSLNSLCTIVSQMLYVTVKIDPEKEKLLRMPTIRQGIVNNNYFTFKSLAKKIFPQNRLSIMLTVSTLKVTKEDA